MAIVLQTSVSPPGACSYLPAQVSELETRLMLEVSPEEMQGLLEHGWRRFGPTYFHPVCAACQECVSLRIPVATYAPTRSQKRARRKCAHLRVEVGTPSVDRERLALYHAWHGAREGARGWEASDLDEERYVLQFAFPHPCAREFAYYDGERLVAIGIVDATRRALSSVYFFFHPDVAHLSLGVASVGFEVEWARAQRLTHLYLGYRVRDCPSLRYKGQFGPHELLQGRPALEERPVWVLAD